MSRQKRNMFAFTVRCLAVMTLVVTVFHPVASGAGGKRMILGVPLYSEDSLPPPDFIKQLNSVLEPEDILFVKAGPPLKLLNRVKRGKVALIRQSVGDLEKDLKILRSAGARLNYLCYNPEQWPNSHTPPEEQRDVVKAAVRARSIAERNKLGLVIVPDSAKTLVESGGRLARQADVFAIQLQRWQALPPEEFRRKTLEAVEIIREQNSWAVVIAQISTNPPVPGGAPARPGKPGKPGGPGGMEKGHVPMSVDEMLARVRTIEDLVDGVGFLIMAEGNGYGRFMEFARRFR